MPPLNLSASESGKRSSPGRQSKVISSLVGSCGSGQPKSSRKSFSREEKSFTFWTEKASRAMSAEFHPRFEAGFHAHRCLNFSEVGVCDVFFNFSANLGESFVGDSAVTRRVGLAADKLDDLGRFFNNLFGAKVIEIPGGLTHRLTPNTRVRCST